MVAIGYTGTVSLLNQCCAGGLMDQAFEYIEDHNNIHSENDYLYTAKVGICQNISETAFNVPVTGFVDVTDDEETLKNAVYYIGPISAAIDGSHDSFRFFKKGIYEESSCSTMKVTHAILIIGYGTTDNGTDYWLIKNSYGPHWGENGYFRLARNKDDKMDLVSVEKKNPLFIQGKCFNDCEAELTVGQEKTQLYVCKDYLAGLSESFRALFFGHFKEKNQKQFQITDETSDDMICFFNTINPDPDFHKINEDSIELLMRLADKFKCGLLRKRLKRYIEIEVIAPNSKIVLNWLSWSVQYHMPQETINICLEVLKIHSSLIEPLMRLAHKYQLVGLKQRLKEYISLLFIGGEYEIISKNHSIQPLMFLADEYRLGWLKHRLKQFLEANEPDCPSASIILKWLIWSVKYHMPQAVVKICLPGVACLPLSTLRNNREKIGWKLYAKLLDVKMQFYNKANYLYNAKIQIVPHMCFWCYGRLKRDRYCQRCREKCDFYYKCDVCNMAPSISECKYQCLCARNNYRILLRKMPY